jgi:hypothetical protein
VDEPVNQEPKKEQIPAELIALLRILLKEPPPDHDFETCEICKAHNITALDKGGKISYGDTSSS